MRLRRLIPASASLVLLIGLSGAVVRPEFRAEPDGRGRQCQVYSLQLRFHRRVPAHRIWDDKFVGGVPSPRGLSHHFGKRGEGAHQGTPPTSCHLCKRRR